MSGEHDISGEKSGSNDIEYDVDKLLLAKALGATDEELTQGVSKALHRKIWNLVAHASNVSGQVDDQIQEVLYLELVDISLEGPRETVRTQCVAVIRALQELIERKVKASAEMEKVFADAIAKLPAEQQEDAEAYLEIMSMF